MDLVEEFLGDRLRGRAVPADLRRLVELQFEDKLAGQHTPLPLGEVRVLEPGELHYLQQPPTGAVSPGVAANSRAILEVLSHVAVVVEGFNGDLFGYWVHPEEPPTDAPPVVKLDTEGQFSVVPGAGLVEAMVSDWAFDGDISEVAAFCDEHGVPLAVRDYDDLVRRDAVVSPAVLHERLYKRNLPYHPRPAWADRAAGPDRPPIGARTGDPAARALLDRLGFPADLGPLIGRADVGEGEVTLTAPGASVKLELYQEDARTWWLYQIIYRRPGEVTLPFGLTADESRAAARERLGKPELSAALVPVDRWTIGELTLYVLYGDDDLPKQVRCWPTELPAS